MLYGKRKVRKASQVKKEGQEGARVRKTLDTGNGLVKAVNGTSKQMVGKTEQAERLHY